MSATTRLVSSKVMLAMLKVGDEPIDAADAAASSAEVDASAALVVAVVA